MADKKLTHIWVLIRILAVSSFLGVIFWLLETSIHIFIFHDGTFIKQLFSPVLHELWMRSFGAAILVLFGVYAQFAIERHKGMKKKVELAYRELNQIFDTAADGMRLIDRDFNVLRVNETFAALSGVDKDEAVGKKCYEIFRGSLCHTPDCPLVGIIDGKKRIECDAIKERKDGTKIPCIVTATPFVTPTGEILGIVEDFKNITERKKTQQRLEDLNRKLLESNEKLKELALRDSHTGLYNHRYLAEALEAEFYRARRYGYALSLIMLDVDYFKSINDVYGHQFGDLVLKQLADQLRRMVRIYDIVIRFGGEEFIIVSPTTDKSTALILAQRLLNAINLYNFGDEKQVVKLRLSIAVVCYPEDSIAKSVDLINIADQILNKVKEEGGGKVYSSLDIEKEKSSYLERISEDTDVGLLKGKIEKLTRRANQSLIEAIFAFAKTIELKDHYTGEHVEKTVNYAVQTAKALDLSKDEIERIKKAARLHDLGKVGISEKILLKKSELTEGEFEEIRKHPQIGVDILRPIQSLRDIIPLILYHQERWDGKGYPGGLKGEEIPIGARIIAVADVYEALISDRPYRKAYSQEEAIEIIKKGSGTQFDPVVVDTFLKILRQEE